MVRQILFLGYWETIVISQAATLWLFQLMGGLSVMMLRRTRPEVLRPYRTWGYPVTPALFLLIGVVFLIAIIAANPVDTLRGLGITALGLPVYWLWVYKRR